MPGVVALEPGADLLAVEPYHYRPPVGARVRVLARVEPVEQVDDPPLRQRGVAGHGGVTRQVRQQFVDDIRDGLVALGGVADERREDVPQEVRVERRVEHRGDRLDDDLAVARALGPEPDLGEVVGELREQRRLPRRQLDADRFGERLCVRAVGERLAEPVDIELTAREAALFAEYREALAELGFRTERVDDRTVEVRSVPAVFASALSPELLRDVLSAFVAEGEEGGTSAVESVADDLLADLACYPSVTGNTSLTEGSVVDLLEALDGCENPYACPHGRPVVVSFDAEEIESRFERDYPGHGGRRGE